MYVQICSSLHGLHQTSLFFFFFLSFSIVHHTAITFGWEQHLLHCQSQAPLSLGGCTPRPSSPGSALLTWRVTKMFPARAQQASTRASVPCSKWFEGSTEENCGSNTNPGDYPALNHTRKVSSTVASWPWRTLQCDFCVSLKNKQKLPHKQGTTTKST